VPRGVADSNIYISALNFSGTADDVLALGRAGVIEIYICPAIIDEIAGVLARKFGWSAPRIREAKQAINNFTVLTRSSRATTTCRLRRILETRITTPREFLDAQARR
jgi:predicted nucleic acid-binding protein